MENAMTSTTEQTVIQHIYHSIEAHLGLGLSFFDKSISNDKEYNKTYVTTQQDVHAQAKTTKPGI